jgi:hypothetical protein
VRPARELRARQRTTLAALGTAEYLGPDPGAAALYDVALLSAMYGMFGGFLHGAALVQAGDGSSGLAARLAALARRWLAAMSAALPCLAEEVDTGMYARRRTCRGCARLRGAGERPG